MLSRMSSVELSEWMAFYELEPWGTDIDLYGHAMTSSTLVNIYRKEGVEPVKPGDMMPKFGEKQSVDDMISKVKVLTEAFKGNNDDSL